MAQLESHGPTGVIIIQDSSTGGKWFDGSGPPMNITGADEGDYYLDVDSGKIYKLNWGEGE